MSNLEQNLGNSNEKLHISDVIGSVDSKIDLDWRSYLKCCLTSDDKQSF